MSHSEYLAHHEDTSIPNYWINESTKSFSDGWGYQVESIENFSRDTIHARRLTKLIGWAKILS